MHFNKIYLKFSIRGAFGSFMVVSVNFGTVLGYLAGAYLSFFTIPLVMLTFPCIFLILFSLVMPDTPNSLIKHHKLKEAKESMMFYRSCNANNIPEKVEDEFKALVKSFEMPIVDGAIEKLTLKDFSELINNWLEN